MDSLIISIITINYNNKSGLEKTIRSVLSQSFKNFEYLIIDGGSSDGSKEIIKEFEKDITYYVSEPDRGVYHAMNKGISKAKGKYIFFLNSGDTFYSNDVLFQFFSHQGGEDIIYGNINFISEDGTCQKENYPEELSFFFFFRLGICHQCVFTKRDCLINLGMYDDTFKIVADWKFLVTAICLSGCSYNHIDVTIANFYTNGISFSQSNFELTRLEKQTVFKKEFKMFYNDYLDYHSFYHLKYSRLFTTLRFFGFYKNIKTF